MLDKKQFDLEMAQVRQDQIGYISEYLSDYIKLNSRIREMPLNAEPDPETLRELAETPIPRAGRDMKEVADELVEKVFQHTVLLQHPKCFSFVTSAVSP